ncbi:hypothetical protein D9M72_464660 [compost metagenome]
MSIASACQRRQLIVSGTSTVWQSRIVLPLSRLSITERSTRLFSMSCARRRRACLRAAGCCFDQRPSANDCRALATAASTSSGPQAGKSASFFPVAGLVVANVRPDPASTERPSMMAFEGRDSLDAICSYCALVRSSVICLLHQSGSHRQRSASDQRSGDRHRRFVIIQ